MRLEVKAGLRTVGVTFPREGAKADPSLPSIRRGGPPAMAGKAPPPTIPLHFRPRGARNKRIEIPDTTPIQGVTPPRAFNPSRRGETPRRPQNFFLPSPPP